MIDRWRNRRAMAWLSLVAGLLFPLLALSVNGETATALAGPFYLFVGAVVGAYIGFSTVDDKWQIRPDLPVAPIQYPRDEVPDA